MTRILNVSQSVLRDISARVIMYIRLVVSWCAAFPFPPRNCLLLPLRISSGGRCGQFNKPKDFQDISLSREHVCDAHKASLCDLSDVDAAL